MPLMPHAAEWTVDDLDRIPDDGLRYELLDGLLLVSSSPVPRHQRALRKLLILLEPACPATLEVFPAPLDWRPDGRTSLQSDAFIVRAEDVGEENISGPLVLVVEILSPSTRRTDLTSKRSKYEDAGVPHYWVVDPDEPSIVTYELRDGRYAETGHAAGDEALAITAPVQITINPAGLVAQ